MAEEAQAPECKENEHPEMTPAHTTQTPECKENEHPEMTPAHTTDITDQVDTSSACETSQCDSMLSSGSPDIILEDKTVAAALVLNDKNEEDIDAGTAPLAGLEDINKQYEDGDKTETPDILLHQQCHPPSETGTEDILTETEEENTSIETDTEYGDDEQENGPQQSPVCGSYEMAGSGPDIHSCSGYDTVSYRKIRKGNTKQRIDEFESMMNL